MGLYRKSCPGVVQRLSTVVSQRLFVTLGGKNLHVVRGITKSCLWCKGISELGEFHFISKIHVSFGTQLIETTKFIPMVINGKWYTNKIIDERTSLQFLWCCSPSHRHICAVAKLTSCLHPYYIWYIFEGIEHISTHFSRQIAPQGRQKGNFRPNLVSMVLSKTFLMKF